MRNILVGLFDSRREADRARQALLAAGIADRHVVVEPGADDGREVDEPLPGDGGLAGFIGRMFSGALLDEVQVERYLHARHRGHFLVAVHGLDDAQIASVRATLETHGGRVDVHAVPSDPRERDRTTDASLRAAEGEVAPSHGSPRNVLPGAPTGWDEATAGERSTIGRRPNDPARPEGLMRDAEGLDPETGPSQR